MEKFKAREYNKNMIQLENAEVLEKLYSIIEADENFILEWEEKGIIMSEVIITTNISSKVKNGELKLTSQEKNEE